MARDTHSPVTDILVVVDLGGERRAVRVAADLAWQTGAHLAGIALAVDPMIPVYTAAATIPTDFIVNAHEQSVADARAALAAFEEIGSTTGVVIESRLIESISGDGFPLLVRHSVLSDLAIVGQDDLARQEPLRDAVIEALLFQSGVPVLLVPYSGVKQFVPDRAVIGWNGSPQAGRAVRAAMPLLARAKEVLVAIVDESPTGMPGVDIGAYLARHDLDVTIRTIGEAPKGVGPALLAFAAAEEATWLVMGAYSHSRLRELFLGGATRHVLANATLPVLFSH